MPGGAPAISGAIIAEQTQLTVAQTNLMQGQSGDGSNAVVPLEEEGDRDGVWDIAARIRKSI